MASIEPAGIAVVASAVTKVNWACRRSLNLPNPSQPSRESCCCRLVSPLCVSMVACLDRAAGPCSCNMQAMTHKGQLRPSECAILGPVIAEVQADNDGQVDHCRQHLSPLLG